MNVRRLGMIAALPVAGFVGQRIAERRDQTRFPIPGQLVTAGDVTVHAVVEGSGPTVLFDSGLGGCSIEWEAIAADLSRDFTVVRYDRPGFGWSPPSAADVGPVAAARRIRALLHELDLPVPAFLVGHSLGGLHVRVVAARYPEMVSGLVLVDPSHEEMLDGDEVPQTAVMGGAISALAVVAPLGLPRVAGRLYGRLVTQQVRQPLDPVGQDIVHRSILLTACSVPGLRAVARELRALPASLDEVKRVTEDGGHASARLTLIAADAPTRTNAERQVRAVIRSLHTALVDAAPSGRLVLASDSGHLVPLDQPDLVASCVRDMVAG